MARIRPILLLAALTAAFPSAALPPQALPPDAVIVDEAMAARAAPGAVRLADDWMQLYEAGEIDSVLVAIEQAEASRARLTVELALTGLVDRIESGLPDPRAAPLLSALSRWPVSVFIRHDETAAEWYLPFVEPGARARSALVLDSIARERESWRARLQRDPITAMAKGFVDAGDAQRAAEALATVDAATVEALAGWIDREAPPLPGTVLVAIAQRVPGRDRFEAAIAAAPERAALGLIAAAPRSLPADDAVALLAGQAADPRLGSAAVLALGELAVRSASAQKRLERWLGDPRLGASAAAALARMPASDRVARIEKALREVEDPAALADVALALRLEGSAAAQAALSRLGRDPRLPAAVREELQR